MAGQGKSTLLNALAFSPNEDDDDEEGEEVVKQHFATGAGGNSCTQKVATKEFMMKGEGGMELKIELTDTMGFPDPDPSKAKEYYDQVIEECNKELNAIVWIMKPERTDATKYKKLEVLMREFNRAKPPVILVVNGCENYAPDLKLKPKVLQKQKNIARKEHESIAQELVQQTGVSVMKPYIVGADIDDLYGGSKHMLFKMLQGTTPQKSEMRTLKQVYARHAAAKTDEERAKLAEEDAKQALDKEKGNVDRLSAIKKALDVTAATVAATAAGFWWIPGVSGVAGAVGATATVASHAMNGDLSSALEHAKEAAKKDQEAFAKKSDANQRAEDAKRTFDQFQQVEEVLNSQGIKKQKKE